MKYTVHFWAGVTLDVDDPKQIHDTLWRHLERLGTMHILETRHVDEKVEGIAVVYMCPEGE